MNLLHEGNGTLIIFSFGTFQTCTFMLPFEFRHPSHHLTHRPPALSQWTWSSVDFLQLDTTLNSKTSLKDLFSNTYLSIDKCHPVTFDLHFRDGHQVLLVIRYIKEIQGFLAFVEESTISLMSCITSHSFDHEDVPRMIVIKRCVSFGHSFAQRPNLFQQGIRLSFHP